MKTFAVGLFFARFAFQTSAQSQDCPLQGSSMLQRAKGVVTAQPDKASLVDLNAKVERSFQRAQKTGDCQLPTSWSPKDLPAYVKCLIDECEDQDGSMLDGLSCEELVPMGSCETDLSEFSPHMPAGTTTAMICSVTCEVCEDFAHMPEGLSCTPWPAPQDMHLPDQERCEYGNTLEDGFHYVYNEGRGTPDAVCGETAHCLCCRHPA